MDSPEGFTAADNLSGHPEVPSPDPDWMDWVATAALTAAVLVTVALIGYGIVTTP